MDAEAIEYLNENFATLESLDHIEKAVKDFD
jgi:hypothetical protein